MLLGITLQVWALIFGVAILAFLAGWILAIRMSAPPRPPPSEPDWHSPLRVSAKVSQGNNGAFSHQQPPSLYAWDYRVPVGAPVVAARSGLVLRSDFHSNIGGGTRDYTADTNRVCVRHSDGLISIYAHLAKGGNPPRVGEFVHQGETIGLSGNTGFSRRPHLHFVVLRSAKSVPIRFADWPSNDGVPQKGDTHPAAGPPRIPDRILSWCKERHRAAAKAHRRGWPDIALHFVHDLEPARGHGDHHTLRLLEHLRAAVFRSATRQVARHTSRRRPDLRVGFETYRMERAMRRLDGADQLVARLSVFREHLPAPIRAELRSCSGPLRSLVRGMRAECSNDAVAAMQAYATAHGEAQAPIQPFIRPIARALAEQYVAQLQRLMVRHGEEAARCQGQHAVAVVQETERLVMSGQAFLRHAGNFLPPPVTLGDDLIEHRNEILGRLL